MVLLRSDEGKPGRGDDNGYLLAGALLADLVVRGRIDLAGPGEAVRRRCRASRSTRPPRFLKGCTATGARRCPGPEACTMA